jgi:3-phenylpropionate/trans-cinnamate dioxygenase ferredoxin subunit
MRSWRGALARERVAAAAELPLESVTYVKVKGIPICLVHAEDGNFYALHDTCTHENYSLSEGWGCRSSARGMPRASTCAPGR